MIGYVFVAAALACVLFTIVKGGWEVRTVAIALFACIWSTRAIYLAYDRDFVVAKWPLLLNEAALLAVYLFVAFRSKRFWPLFACGFEVPAFLALMTPMFGSSVASYGLGVAQGLWAYLQMLVIVLATIRRPPSETKASSPG